MILALLALLGTSVPATLVLLPAYAHNDYANPRPLVSALELGYRGAEADVFLVDGELRVGHDRGELLPGRTLDRLYLAPLEARRREYGTVLPDGTPFLLTVEAKEPGVATYAAIERALAAYPQLVTRYVAEGREVPAPVRVVQVGWHPPLETLARSPLRYSAVQLHAADPRAASATWPVSLVPLITQDYRQAFRWRGSGPMPRDQRYRLARLVEAAHAVPGRRLRIIHAPVDAAVYRVLREAGVDLIGTKNLERSALLLTRPSGR